jgi:hypothetical protein
MQGFKVKTAERINHTAKGKLYVNKLSALSATILYALMIVEMISVCLPVNEVLKFNYASYLIGAAGLLLYPLVTYVLLVINPKKTTDRIATFKYSLSVAVVTLLNLILLTFVFALVMQIDLHSAQNLMYYIVIPIIVFMNIPMYYIIKYVLISKGIYFIKD